MSIKPSKSDSSIEEIESRIPSAVAEEKQLRRTKERNQRIEKTEAKLFRKIKPLEDAFKLIDKLELNYRDDLCEIARRLANRENLSQITTTHVTKANLSLYNPQKKIGIYDILLTVGFGVFSFCLNRVIYMVLDPAFKTEPLDFFWVFLAISIIGAISVGIGIMGKLRSY